ncbi:MAG TPA: arginine deiminase family protein [Gemmatimonadales bacterium]|nr:arginine deiminase family protein [Gemmatimonadales bacterium]
MVGGQNEVGRLRQVAVKHVRDAFASDARIAREWQALHYLACPDYSAALTEYAQFLEVLRDAGADVRCVPANDAVGLDSLYVRDAAVVCDRGVILCNMGKPARRGEPDALDAAFGALDLPILGRISNPGRLEGGDVLWIDERTLAVGRGYRTNDEGIRQLQALLGDAIDELVVVPLPHWRGPSDVFHLMSLASPLDRDLCLVYAPLMPVPFRETLLARGIELVEVPDAEFPTLGCNVLALAPRRVAAVAGNPGTRSRLERVGVEVREFPGREICLKGGGGPTCLTRPLWRQ